MAFLVQCILRKKRISILFVCTPYLEVMVVVIFVAMAIIDWEVLICDGSGVIFAKNFQLISYIIKT